MLNLFNFPRIDSHLKSSLILDGRKYEIELFKIKFSQPIDSKQQPQSEMRGGQMMITLTQTVPDLIYNWAMKPNIQKNGSVVFSIETGSAPLKIEFTNAKCIQINRSVNASGGLRTNLIISPEIIMMNGIEHNNFWIE